MIPIACSARVRPGESLPALYFQRWVLAHDDERVGLAEKSHFRKATVKRQSFSLMGRPRSRMYSTRLGVMPFAGLPLAR